MMRQYSLTVVKVGEMWVTVLGQGTLWVSGEEMPEDGAVVLAPKIVVSWSEVKPKGAIDEKEKDQTRLDQAAKGA